MEYRALLPLINLLLLVLVTGLFVFIKYYFLTKTSIAGKKLQHHEVAIAIFMGFVVSFVICNQGIPFVNKALFFGASVGLHCVMSWLEHKTHGTKSIYPRSFMIFHNGNFLKGAIGQHKITEKDIRRLLNLKGIFDLTEIDTIILEKNGELSVIYKNKMKAT
ncbi:MAG TPA: YetF domain-containing protein [Chryseosolibacter sp.]|nr:YetF domain-containing protein [Chryseosolibacter sp.]